MGKIVDGLELLRMLRDGEIKKGTEIRYGSLDLKVVERMFSRDLTIEEKNGRKFTFSAYGWINTKFEIILEDEEIDIEAIEELNLFDNGRGFDSKIDVRQFYDSNFEKISNGYKEMLKAIKQLNKQMKEK